MTSLALQHELATLPGGAESTEEMKQLKSHMKESHGRRQAEMRLKEAERLKAELDARRQDEDARTRKRMEEAARFQDQKHLWWEHEVAHQIQASKDNHYTEELQDRAEDNEHSAEVEKQVKQIARVENLIRLRQEQEAATRAAMEKKAKEAADDMFMKSKKKERDVFADNQRQMAVDIKAKMQQQTKVEQETEKQREAERAMRGEKERVFLERSRQDREAELARFKAADKDEEKKLFRMDEASRADFKDRKTAKSKLRRKQGVDRMTAAEEERKAAEKAEKEKMEAEKKAFRSKTRVKEAQKQVIKEHEKRIEEERLAANAEYDAQRALADMELAKQRDSSALSMYQQVSKPPSKLENLGARTEYEAKQRALYGTPGSSDNMDMGSQLAFINN